jgi:hypothetical protein
LSYVIDLKSSSLLIVLLQHHVCFHGFVVAFRQDQFFLTCLYLSFLSAFRCHRLVSEFQSLSEISALRADPVFFVTNLTFRLSSFLIPQVHSAFALGL